MQTISLKQAIAHIDSGRPFSCEAVAYDRSRRKGGHIKVIHEGRVSKKMLPPYRR